MILYFLLDVTEADEAPALAALLDRLDSGWDVADVVQVRAKRLGAGRYVELLANVLARCRLAAGASPRLGRGDGGLGRTSTAGRPIVLANDRADVALASGVDGVHVGADDLPPEEIRRLALPEGFVVGLTCHTPEELAAAPARGADYAAVGPFHPSPTKPHARGEPRAALASAGRSFPLPVYAIGGFTLANVGELRDEPAVRGVVVASAIRQASDPAAALRRWRAALDRLESG